MVFVHVYGLHRVLRSFPTTTLFRSRSGWRTGSPNGPPPPRGPPREAAPGRRGRDRKSTRLNSSHLGISYAVFCLKKKKAKPERPIDEGTTWPELGDWQRPQTPCLHQ